MIVTQKLRQGERPCIPISWVVMGHKASLIYHQGSITYSQYMNHLRPGEKRMSNTKTSPQELQALHSRPQSEMIDGWTDDGQTDGWMG
ncbi:hypothetical protein LEMLEM_LOCUS6534, partial [Lemmus lemmus]